jgi:hypothetical protein
VTSPSISPELFDTLEERRSDPKTWLGRRFVRFIQILFRHCPLGSYRHCDNENESEILITDQVPLFLEAQEQRPAIQMVVGSIQNLTLGLNHMESLDFKTGASTHLDLLAGQVSFNIHASNEDVADRIAYWLLVELRNLRQEAMKFVSLHDFGPKFSKGPASPPGALIQGSTSKSVMVSVMAPFFYADRWTKTPKMIPFGSADKSAYGRDRHPGTDLEEPHKLDQVLIDTKMLKPGQVFSLEEGLRQFKSAPISPPTLRGRQQVILKTLDEAKKLESSSNTKTKVKEK